MDLLRTSFGQIYFVNLVTGHTRWLPPHRWMEDWVSRVTWDPQNPLDFSCLSGSPFLGHKLSQLIQPPGISRLRVEGGAPYLCHKGQPQYESDESDSSETYPLP